MTTNSCFKQMYLINPPKALHIPNVAKVLQSDQEGVFEVAKLKVNYYTANEDATDSYVKVSFWSIYSGVYIFAI